MHERPGFGGLKEKDTLLIVIGVVLSICCDVACYKRCAVLLLLLMLFCAVFLLINTTHERPEFGCHRNNNSHRFLQSTLDPRKKSRG
jgi:hypothetical protein